jgi:Ras-related C3 botulinum toxin substrate 1
MLANFCPQWVPEINHHAPNVPMVLVGTKLDLREDPDIIDKLRDRRMSPISFSEGNNLAKDIGAVKSVPLMPLS